MRTIVRKLVVVSGLLFLYGMEASSQVAKPGGTLGFNLIYASPTGEFKKEFNLGVGGEVTEE